MLRKIVNCPGDVHSPCTMNSGWILVSGRTSDERGLMHSKQVVERYEAKEAVFQHNAI